MEKNSVKKYKVPLIILSALLVCVFAVQCLYWGGLFRKSSEQAETAAELTVPETDTESEPLAAEVSLPEEPEEAASSTSYVPSGDLSREGYELEQVVVFSRHNIRSPLSGKGSVLSTVTPHEWFEWSSAPSELSLRGGLLETGMGQYFRKWLEAEGLFPENWHPDEDAVRIYANSKQRTIATAQYFTAGLLPTANFPVEYHMEFDKMDPVFTPQLTYVSPEYAADAEAQMLEYFGEMKDSLDENYRLLADVIDMDESEAIRDGSMEDLTTEDIAFVLNLNAEPGLTGSLKTACSVSDALVLQYYEEPDPVKAAFGKDLTWEQWKAVSKVKDDYVDILYTTPLVSLNVAHPLLQEIEAELQTEGRKFSFLCGHDSNVASLLSALGAEEYELPGAIEAKTPIGCKLVFSRWRGQNGSSWISVDMVYQTVEQLRSTPVFDLGNPPAIVPMRFTELAANPDGLYPEEDFLDLLADRIDAYDAVIEQYSLAAAA